MVAGSTLSSTNQKGTQMISRNAILSAICLVTISLSAALPTEFDGYFYHLDDERSFQEFHPDKGVIELPSGQKITPLKLRLEAGEADLDALAPSGTDRAVLCTTFHSEKARLTWLGVGCRVFAVSCNGKNIYSFLNKGLGNDYFPLSSMDHIFPLELKEGQNEIVIQTYKTNWMLDFCYGKSRQDQWRIVLKEYPAFQPVRAALLHPPFFSRLDGDSVTVTLLTKEPVAVGMDIRLKGTDIWQRTWDLAGELVLRENTRIHCFKIEHLLPGKSYEYRVILLEPPVGKQGFRRALWSEHKCTEVIADEGIYLSPPEKNIRFFMFGDTQLSLSTKCRTAVEREKFMRKLRQSQAYEKADFIVHAGDVTSYFHDVEKALFTDFLDHFKSESAVRPWVYVRGNHECNGLGAEAWYDYFLPSGETSYYAFLLGEILFIVLDCGDFPADPTLTSSGPLICRAYLMQRQGMWLDKLRKSPEFRNARFRIILSHTEPLVEPSNVTQELYQITREMLQDTSEQGMIHLWLGGHIHYYWRMNRGDASIRVGKGEEPPDTSGKKSPVTFLTMDGPKESNHDPVFSAFDVTVNHDKISVRVLDDDERLIDHFAVDHSGTVLEEE